MTDANGKGLPARVLLLGVGDEQRSTLEAICSDTEFHHGTMSGAVAADLVSRFNLQLVLCALGGDVQAAVATLREIRQVDSRVIQVALLEGPDFGLAREAFRAGADDVLLQPLVPARLIEVWSELAAQRTARLASPDDEARRSLDDLVLLRAVGETTRRATTLQTLLDRTVELIRSALDVDIVSLQLREGDVLRIRAARGVPDEVVARGVSRCGEGISGHVLESGRSVLISDLSRDGRFPLREDLERYRSGSLLSVPVQCQQKVIGVLNVNNKRDGSPFNAVDQELLSMIAHQTALAIENFKLIDSLQQKSREVEKAHASLVRLHDDRTRFVCNLSHELKTPLTSVLGYADLLLNFFDQVDPSRMREYVADIYRSGKALEHLLNGMLRLFAIDSGGENWDWQSVELAEVVERVLLEYEDRIAARELIVEAELAEELPQVWGARDKLELLLSALVDNAIKFNRQGGRLSLRADPLELYGKPAVYLRIANDGETVPRESAEDVFEGYSQLGRLDAGKPSGVGIGLATSRAILRQMQGEIVLEPGEGEGTAFGLLLPGSAEGLRTRPSGVKV
jgi:signal transduction histidine kinase/CheY-like chemotaxis protein